MNSLFYALKRGINTHIFNYIQIAHQHNNVMLKISINSFRKVPKILRCFTFDDKFNFSSQNIKRPLPYSATSDSLKELNGFKLISIRETLVEGITLLGAFYKYSNVRSIKHSFNDYYIFDFRQNITRPCNLMCPKITGANLRRQRRNNVLFKGSKVGCAVECIYIYIYLL